MRLLKFRMWNEANNKVYYFKDKHKMTDADEKCGCFIPSERLGDIIDFCDKNIVMQYTGLKDKNDKEIYEGDILYDENLKDERPFVVVWTESEARFNLYFDDGKTNDKYDLFCHCGFAVFDSSVSSRMEAVGNIYENSELVEVK